MCDRFLLSPEKCSWAPDPLCAVLSQALPVSCLQSSDCCSGSEEETPPLSSSLLLTEDTVFTEDFLSTVLKDCCQASVQESWFSSCCPFNDDLLMSSLSTLISSLKPKIVLKEASSVSEESLWRHFLSRFCNSTQRRTFSPVYYP